MKPFKIILKWVKKQGIMPGIGEFKETLGQTLWWGTLVSFVMMAGTFYYTTLRFVLPWYTLPKFVTTMILGVVIIYIFEHKYGVKSLWEYHWKLMGGGAVVTPKTSDKSVTVAVSGGFDPVHPGHIAYINEALKLGTHLLVILTRDEQLIEKDRLAGGVKNRKPIPYDVRKAILEWGLGDKGEVVMNIDKDITSCVSMKRYRPDIFAKGGDSWDLDNLPEKPVCDELGIEIVFGVGGYDKPYSSSELSGVR